MSRDIKEVIKEYIDNAGSLTKAALELGTSRRSLGRYRDGEVEMPEELINKIALNEIEEVSDFDLISDYIERTGSLTQAALLLGTSRRSLGRYRDGEVALPENLRDAMFEDRMQSNISDRIQIPGTLAKSYDEDNVLYFEAKISLSNHNFEGYNSSFPVLTVAESVDYADEVRPFTVVKGQDGCIILVNPDKTTDVTAEYMNINEPKVQFYLRNAMQFHDENQAYVSTSGYPDLSTNITREDIEEIFDSETFLGDEKDDIGFIVLDRESSKDFLAVLEDKLALANKPAKTKSPSI